MLKRGTNKKRAKKAKTRNFDKKQAKKLNPKKVEKKLNLGFKS